MQPFLIIARTGFESPTQLDTEFIDVPPFM